VLGTDAGGFDWRELNQAMEFDYYVKYGMTPCRAIPHGHHHSRRIIGLVRQNGLRRKGKWADIVAVSGDPLKTSQNSSALNS